VGEVVEIPGWHLAAPSIREEEKRKEKRKKGEGEGGEIQRPIPTHRVNSARTDGSQPRLSSLYQPAVFLFEAEEKEKRERKKKGEEEEGKDKATSAGGGRPVWPASTPYRAPRKKEGKEREEKVRDSWFQYSRCWYRRLLAQFSVHRSVERGEGGKRKKRKCRK